MIKPILEKKWPASDGSTHLTLGLAQEREILLIIMNGRSDTPTDTETGCANRMVTQAADVVAVLRNKPARGKDKQKRKLKAVAKPATEKGGVA